MKTATTFLCRMASPVNWKALLWMWIFPCLILPAQSSSFRNYTVRSGLPSNTVHRVLQDSQGYLWMATSSGISRFDGHEFKNYSSGGTSQGHEILNFFQDSQGRIWLQNSTGNPEYFFNGTFFNSETDSLLKGGELGTNLLNGLEDDAGTIWMHSLNNVLRKAPGKKIENKTEIGGQAILGALFIFKDQNGDVLLATRGEFTYNLSRNSYFPNGISNGERLIGHYHQGSSGLIYKSIFKRLHIYRDPESAAIREVELPVKKNILSIREESSGTLAIGTWSGLYLFEPSDSNFSSGKHLLDGIPISSTFVDREGNRWVTSLEHGVFCIPNTQLDQWTVEQGLPKGEAQRLCKDSEGHLWVGFAEGHAGYLDQGTFIYQDLDVPESGLGNKCMDMVLGLDGKMWFAYERHLVSWDNGKTQSHLIPSKSLYISPDGRFWVPTYSKIAIFPSEDKLETLNRAALYRLHHPSKRRAKHLASAPDGELYAATFEGMERINDSVMVAISDNYEANHIAFLPTGTALVSTHGKGVNVLHGKSSFYVDESAGLSSNYCNVSAAIDDTTFWVGSNAGLDKITLRQNQAPSVANLLQEKTNDLLVSGDSTWAATQNGMVLLDNKTMPSSFQPIPILQDFHVNNQPIDLAQSSSLESKQNNISLKWTACYFQNPTRIRFRFQLEGIDKAWRHTKQRQVEYSNLPPGDYTFHLESSPDGQHWKATEQALTFTIQTPFWRTWTFSISATLALLLMAIFLYNRRIRAIRQKSSLIADSMKQREIALRAQMNPHFVFNALNSIQQYILIEDPDGALGYLSKFSKLIRLILENSLESIIPLENELEALRLYLELEKMRVGEKFQYEIHVGEGLETEFIAFPGLVLQPLAENAIWHGILPKKEGKGQLRIDIRLENELVKVVVEDNGVGREASHRNRNLGDMNKKTSLGLENIRERLRLFAQNNDIEAVMELDDLMDEKGQPAGTKITLVIPHHETNN